MYRLYLVRPVKPSPPQSAKRSAKVIELRVRREAQRALREVPPRPDRLPAALTTRPQICPRPPAFLARRGRCREVRGCAQPAEAPVSDTGQWGSTPSIRQPKGEPDA